MLAQIKAALASAKARIDATFWNAVTMMTTIIGSIVSHVDTLAEVVGDPSLNQTMQSVITDAKWFGRWMLAVGIVAAVARLKSLISAPPKAS